ncbi:phosphatase PAP2 family protein [Pseudomonas sp. LS44]|uniref:phosphatase PAP2 family protein n=1 Tax=Pseudomonas sp. LS44 TaxID=1357074 RepID=UPI00215B1BDE|nr:phosphatase PAP2 family protein [Pseudomonas sp. LS44]UVE18629.1 phosphatase PAP2 family protein [Pseudomonas sp. LS44]
MPPANPSRSINLWLYLGLPLSLIVLLLIADPTRLDFTIAHLFYSSDSGFIGRHDTFLEAVLHDRAKQAVILIGVLAIAGLLASVVFRGGAHLRRPLGYLVLAMGLSTAIVTPLKALTAVQCPWDLRDFGGQETYSALLAERPATLHPGRCWPGGHASSGFAFFSLFFLLRDRRPRLARVALLGALILGGVFSLARMLQGAHFLSHNLWTALFDWLICLGAYRLVLYRQATTEPQHQALPASP